MSISMDEENTPIDSNPVRRVARNTAFLFVGDIVGKVALLLYGLFVAGFIGVESYGLLSGALAFMAIFENFNDLGLNQLTVRETSKQPESREKYMASLFPIKLLLSGGTLLAVVLVAIVLGFDGVDLQVTIIIAISSVVMIFNNVFNVFFQSHERLEYQSIGGILYNLLLFAFGMVGIFLAFDIYWFAFSYILVACLVLVYSSVIYTVRFSKPTISWNPSLWRVLLRKALPFFVARLSVSLYGSLYFVMLKLLRSNEEVGWFNAAYKIVLMLATFIGMVYTSLYPTLSILNKQGKTGEIQELVHGILKYVGITGILAGLLLNTFSEQIIHFLYPPEYGNSIQVLKVVSWMLYFYNLSSMATYLLITTNEQGTWMRGVVLVCGINFVVNLLLISAIGMYGASFAVLITEGVLSMILLFGARSQFSRSTLKDLLKISIIGAIPAMLMHVHLGIDMVVQGIACIGLFLLLLFVSGSVSLFEIKKYWKLLVH